MAAPGSASSAFVPAVSAEYKFYQLQNLKFVGLSKKSTIDSLKKWGLHDGLRVQGYSFDAPYRRYLQQQFVQDFFNDPRVRSTFGRRIPSESSEEVGAPASVSFSSPSFTVHEVVCKATSMSLFDKLLADRSILYDGQAAAAPIKQCPEVNFQPPNAHGGDVLILENELKKMIVRARGDGLGEDDYDYDYNEDQDREDHKGKPDYDYAEEYSEFIFRLFGHLVLGGSLCQSEDTARPYLDVTKLLYKDLISVSSACGRELHGTSDGELVVHSIVLQLDADFLFRKPQYNNIMYLIIDTRKNVCYTLYNQIID